MKSIFFAALFFVASASADFGVSIRIGDPVRVSTVCYPNYVYYEPVFCPSPVYSRPVHVFPVYRTVYRPVHRPVYHRISYRRF